MKRKIIFILMICIGLFIIQNTINGQSKIQNYTYDNLDRLTLVLYKNGVQMQYGFDQLGNRILLDVNADCPISTGINISAITETSATVSWSNTGYPSSVSGFDVEISQDNNTWTPLATGLTVFTYNITGLTAGLTYYVRVISNCTTGTQAASAGVPFSTAGAGVVTTIGDCPEDDFDTDDPVFINCPSTPYVFGNDPDLCGAYVNFSIPVAMDNCPGVTVFHSGGAQPGDFLSVGMHTATYTALDTAGNTSNCTFIIDIKDTQRPLLACPDFKILENDFGQCSRQVFGIAPRIAYDNCEYEVTWSAPGATPSGGADDASGTIFPVGTTTVTYTIRELNNPDGNQTASCSFDITIRDTELPTRNFCPADIEVSSAPEACGQIVTYDMPTFNDNCDGSGLTGVLTEGLLSGSFFPAGNTRVVWSYTDAAGNGPVQCVFNVRVIEDVIPEIFCEELTSCTQYTMSTPLDIKPNDVSTFTFNVPAEINITDVNIKNMSGSHPAMEDIVITLTSPAGTVVTLFSQECTGSAAFTNIGMDDSGSGNYVSGSCNLVNNFTYFPDSPLAAFNGQRSAGIWTLSVISTYTESCGSIDNWTLEICGNDITTAANRLQVLADPGTCTYTMTGKGFDPRFTDNCPDPYIRHNYIYGPFNNTLQGSQFALGENLITWTVYDQSGNSESCNIIIDVLDNQAPEFINCPTQDIVQNAETGTCGAYVTFSQPIAQDNCNEVIITKIDDTGLNSGSVFPVGMTILMWQAEDPSGNITQCSLRVIVNDTQKPGFACPGDVLENTDPGKCGAKVFQIGPTLISDNCTDNISVVWQTEWPKGSGEIVNGGVVNASGELFYKDISNVSYRLADHPLVLITEVTHAIDITNGGMHPSPYTVINNDDYLEITNLGPATMNLSGLEIERLSDTDADVFTVPDNTIMEVGNTMVIHFGNGTDNIPNLFFNVPCATDWSTSVPSAYIMSFKGRVLDVVSLNGFNPVGKGSVAVVAAADWSGAVESMMGKGGAYRRFSYDNNSSKDWIVAHTCDPITVGVVNPEIDIIPDNGATSAFQSIAPHIIECDFDIVVVDQELPYCGEFDEHFYSGATNLGVQNSIAGGVIYKSVINVPDNFKIGELALRNVQGLHPDLSELHFKLVGPSGKEVDLFDGLCPGGSNFDFSIANDTLPRINTAPCSPLGQGGTYSTENDISAVTFGFYGTLSAGEWTLIICDSVAANSGQLNHWELVLYEIENYSQTDTSFANETGLCGAEFTWIHPRLIDNCKAGTIELKFVTEDDINVPQTPGFIEPATEITRFFEVGTTTVRYILTDGSNNIDSCEFDVTILDTENPFVLCPDNFHIYLDGGECRKIVCYEPLIAIDNCAVVDTVYSIEPCSFFEIGETKVYITIYDPAGNSTTCDFDVKVFEHDVESAMLTCNDEISIALDESCVAEILPDMLFEGSDYRCYEKYTVTLMYLNGDTLSTSPFVTAENLNDTLMYTVRDGESGNECMGIIIVLKSLLPEIKCPPDTTIQCNVDPLRYENGELATGYLELLSCELNYTTSFDDQYIEYPDCSDPIAAIIRSFTFIDEDGQKVSCDQKIDIAPFNFEQLVFPNDIIIDCDKVAGDPGLLLPKNTGYPKYQNGELISNWEELCDLSFTYEDLELHICEGSYEILRTWIVRNRCIPVSSQNPIRYTQVIEVLDKKPPYIIDCPEDMLISTTPFNCEGKLTLPIPSIIEDCSSVSFEAEIFGNGFLNFSGKYEDGTLVIEATKLDEGGNALVRYYYEDACGNETTCQFRIKVEDQFPPFAVCEQYKQVGVTFGGVAEVAAESFNSGSFDNCKPVWFKVWRDDGGCMDLNCDNTACTQQWFDDSVFFCCEDVGNEIMVTLRVFEVDPGPGPINPSRMLPGGDLYGHFNDCMATTLVQDKSVPLMACQDVTITCEDNTDPEFTGYPDVISTCGNYDLQFTDDLSRLNPCGIGYITRTWKVFVGGELKGQCNQRINVIETLPFDPLTIVFPYISEAQCLKPEPSGEQPTWTTNPCNVVEASIIGIDTFRFVEDACYKILREWAVIDWCTYQANTGAELNLDEYRYISGDRRAILDPAKFTQADRDGYYRFTEVIMVYDDTPANIVVTDTCLGVATCVTAQNTYRLEADSYETETDCGGEYEWTYVIHSECCDDVIQFSANNNAYKGANYQGGVSGRASEDKLDGTKASLLILPSLEQGRYKVTWTLSDGCGNVTTEYQYFDVVDKKAPTPFLVDIATATMTEDCMVEIEAIFFDKGACDNNCLASYDNCSDVLYFTYTPVLPKIDATWSLDGFGLYYFNPATGARSNRNAYLAGNAHSWDPVRNTSGKVFFGPSKEIFVDVFVWDKFSLNEACDDGNFDFATVLLNLNSEDGDGCAEEFNIVNGFTNNTANGEGIINVEVAAMKDGESKFVMTDESGEFVHLHILGPVDFIPRKTDDYQNGVNTLDLILIQRHILGIEAMEGDQLIAADANANNTITAADMKQIRDLILGVTTKFPNNDSWVFVPKKYSLFVTLPTTLTFGGIKVGDTNRNALSNFNGELLTPRHRNTQKLVIDEAEVSVGKTVGIDFYAKDFADVRGFQFTLNTPGLKYLGYQSGALDLNAENIGVIRDGVTTMSWNEADGVFAQDDAVLFTLLFESAVNSDLSKLVSITSEITPAESYRNDALESTNMALEFRGQTPEIFELYQNEPNPFTRNSVIRFTLPYAGEYTLKVFDATGKELKSITDQGQKGMNQEIIENPGLIPGLMYYQLSFDKFVSNKKMILVN